MTTATITKGTSLDIDFISSSHVGFQEKKDLEISRKDVSGSTWGKRIDPSMTDFLQSKKTDLIIETIPTWNFQNSAVVSDYSLMVTSRYSRNRPDVKIDPSSHSLLVGSISYLADQTIDKIHIAALRNYIQVTKVEVRGFVDPDENISELVIHQYVNVSARMALDYWDKLGEELEFWLDTLTPSQRQIFEEKIAIEIRWRA